GPASPRAWLPFKRIAATFGTSVRNRRVQPAKNSSSTTRSCSRTWAARPSIRVVRIALYCTENPRLWAGSGHAPSAFVAILRKDRSGAIQENVVKGGAACYARCRERKHGADETTVESSAPRAAAPAGACRYACG